MTLKWWENASGVVRYSPKHANMTINDIILELDIVKESGIDAIEIFAPIHGGVEYNGLDVIDFYSIDPAIGNIDDLKRLIQLAHQKGLYVIFFINVGYTALECPQFMKACRDIREGHDTPETHWFIWSDTGEETFDKSLTPHFLNDEHGYWHYHELAQKYYWVKWSGINGDTHLPQLNFGDPIWQEECKKIVKFWMEMKADGLVIDAVNWYMNCNWQINNETMTNIIHQYPNQYIQPEGAGGFKDDPVPWIEKGRYNSVQDYALNCWWDGHDLFGKALQEVNPDVIEECLISYRDRVVEAGGVTYIGPHWPRETTNEQRILEFATIASIGQFLYIENDMFHLDWPEVDVLQIKQILKALQKYPALQASGKREVFSGLMVQGIYAFIRSAKHTKEQILVVLNFDNQEQEAIIQLTEYYDGIRLRSIFTGEERKLDSSLQIKLAPYGYQYFLLLDEKNVENGPG